jgi:hypothetical protein
MDALIMPNPEGLRSSFVSIFVCPGKHFASRVVRILKFLCVNPRAAARAASDTVSHVADRLALIAPIEVIHIGSEPGQRVVAKLAKGICGLPIPFKHTVRILSAPSQGDRRDSRDRSRPSRSRRERPSRPREMPDSYPRGNLSTDLRPRTN